MTRVKALWHVMAPIKASNGKPQYSPRQIMTHTRATHAMAHTRTGHGVSLTLVCSVGIPRQPPNQISWHATNIGL